MPQKPKHSNAALRPLRSARRFWHTLGPGLTTGAADDDPSGIATYSQTGSQFGFQLVWMALLTLPLMGLVQEMCARIGMVTGKGLAANIRSQFPKWVLLSCATLLVGANALNIGADLGAMAKATQLMLPHIPFIPTLLALTILSLLLQVFMPYKKYSGYLKWLTFVLFAYILTAFIIRGMPWNTVFHNLLLPTLHFSKEQIILICAIVGTTISPYLFFWQTSQEVEEEIAEGRTTVAKRKNATWRELHFMRVDVWSGMTLSNLVMFFIIIVCAATLFPAGITTIQSAEEAARALQPLAGSNATLLFTLGIVGTGLLAVPVLAGSAAYAVTEAMQWKEGLYRKLAQARAFYSVIIVATVLGLALNFFNINPITTLVTAAVVNGIVAPVMLVCIVLLASNKKVMGEHVNRPLTTWFGWGTVVLLAAVSIGAVIAL